MPRRIRYLADFRMTDSQWDGLMMPINMAFSFKSTPQERVIALYPSPAGATESLLSFDTWEEIEIENPVLFEMEADVEALLVNRIGHARGFAEPEHYMVPIDECFKLVGLIRSRWSELSGGTEAWRDIGQFFTDLKERSPRHVCPGAYDLGEDVRLVLLSVTEGEDKPLKYPTIFNTADIAIVTKMDLAEAVEFDAAAAEGNIRRVRPGMEILNSPPKRAPGWRHG